MNEDRLRGRWKQLKGRIREQWGRMTADDLDIIDGRREQLLGRIQEQRGHARDHVAGAEDRPGPARPGQRRRRRP